MNKSFQPDEVSYDCKGAKPDGLNVEATFSFGADSWFQKPTNIVLNYGKTTEAAALGIPRYLYGGAYQVAVLKNTLVTLEYLHKRDYGKDVSFSTQEVPEIQFGTNNIDNEVIAQFDVYF